MTVVCWCSVNTSRLVIAHSEGMFKLPLGELLRNSVFTGMQDKFDLSERSLPPKNTHVPKGTVFIEI